ncbi:hypothetical protein KM043_011412 [Ampulex compressa]|nr:hypothetical protein KM043_011412 [Ampulex compressa]
MATYNRVSDMAPKSDKERKVCEKPPREYTDYYLLAFNLLGIGFGFLHRWHVSTLFENDRHFSHLSEIEREMSFRTEMGMYYSYYKTIAESNDLEEGINKLWHDTLSEYGNVINAARKYNLLPEIIAGSLFHNAKALGIISVDQCWQIERGDGIPPVTSCEGLGVPIYFYLEIVWFSAMCTAAILFHYATYLSKSVFGGFIAIFFFFYNHNECTRVQWTPPLRESFAYPILLFQMYKVTMAISKHAQDKEKSMLHISINMSLIVEIYLSTLFALCCWQFSQFVLMTQMIALLILKWLNIISNDFYILLCVIHGWATTVASIIFDSNLLCCSLYTCLLIASSITSSMDRLPRFLGTKAQIALEIIMTILFTRAFRLYANLESEDDAHIFNILRSKLTDYKDFHTMLYTCSAEFDFSQYRTYEAIIKTLLLPTAILAGILILYYWYRTFQIKAYPLCIEPAMAYNCLQTAAFIIMAFFIMRLKLFMNPHLCIISGTVCAKRYLEKLGLKTKTLRIAIIVLLLAAMSYRGIPKVQEERGFMGEYSNIEQEELFEWIKQNTPQRAVFAGKMSLMANLMLSTRRAIVNNPYYESKEMRDRTMKVYEIFSRKDAASVYVTLRKMQVGYVVLDEPLCLGFANVQPGCQMIDLWDTVDNGSAKAVGKPPLCPLLFQGNAYPFRRAFSLIPGKMRSEVGEWLATCVGSPICILLLSWSLLIYQNQPTSAKRRIDILTVAIVAESLVHQLGLLAYAILTLIRPTNHFGELCSTLVWLLNSSSILEELTLTSIAIFAAISSKEDGPNVTKNHLKYHLVSLSVISACIGVTGVLNFEPNVCVFLAQEVSVKYGIFVNSLRCLLFLTSLASLIMALFKNACRSSKSELLKSVSDLSETSSKNSSGAFECQTQHWDPSSGSCTSGSTNSRACLRKKKVQVDETSGRSTVYSILFVCYVFQHLPILIISIRPAFLGDFCTPQNLATWLPLVKDTLLPVFLALFDKMFCRYVAKVYTKQSHTNRLSHGGIDGKFRHFEQDTEYKLQLNLNHGLKFPLTNGSLYGRLHNHQNRGKTGSIAMGVQHYPRSMNEDSNYASLPPEMASFTSSTFEPHRDTRITESPKKNSSERRNERSKSNESFQELANGRRRIGTTDVFGQNMENLVQLEAPCGKRKFAKSLDEIREEPPRRHARSVLGLESLIMGLEKNLQDQQRYPRIALRRNQSFDHTRCQSHQRTILDSRTYDLKRDVQRREQQNILQRQENQIQTDPYETSDDESCDLENGDFDTMSSCRSRSRSCCSVTTVANDDFEYFQRKGTKVELLPSKRAGEVKVSMRSFTPRIIESGNEEHEDRRGKLTDSKPSIQSYHLKKQRIGPGYSMNDLDKLTVDRKLPNLSMESLKSILKNSDVSYLDNGDICRHDIGGSAPDFKKIFVTEFI